MEKVPEEFNSILSVGCSMLTEAAEKVMWVTEMLGNDKFIMNTNTGFEITIEKKEVESDGTCQTGQ